MPSKVELYQNFPNPFNPSTEIIYDISQSNEIELVIFNLLGKEVKQLVSKKVEPGKYKVVWNGKDNLGNEVSSGVYFYRLKTEQVLKQKKLILLR